MGEDHETNKADLERFRIPSCMGVSASAWVMGMYPEPLKELQDAVNEELRVIQGMRPHRVSATMAPTGKAISQRKLGDGPTAHPQPAAATRPHEYQIGDTIET